MTSPPRHILVVDDDPAVRCLLRDCFELEGYRVTEAASGEDIASILADGGVDLITLDLNLGGEDGLEVARRVRATCNVPIVMISGKGDTIDRVVGLELGADDYISKPFHVREVLARIRAVLRRYDPQPADRPVQAGDPAPAHAPQRYRFANWTLDCTSRSLAGENREAPDLTTAEFNLLQMFLDRPGRVLSRDNIMDLLKGQEWSPYDRSIDSAIVRLRRKIEPCPEKPSLIKTVRGVGYVFAGGVQRA